MPRANILQCVCHQTNPARAQEALRKMSVNKIWFPKLNNTSSNAN